MRINIKKLALLAILAMVVAGATARTSAQDMPTNTPKPKAKSSDKPATAASSKPLPFNGKLGAVDMTTKTITLDEKTKRVFEITSETKLTRNGKPAVLADAIVGDKIGGSYKQTEDGKLSAVTVNFGDKSEPVKPKTPAKTNSAPASASKD